MAPTVLFASTCRWLTTARLAMAFASAGWIVEVVCPRDHPVDGTRAVSRTHRYHALTPLQSLQAAIDAGRPDLVVPCDDDATVHLQNLYARAITQGEPAARLAALVVRSLGHPSSFGVVRSRAGLMNLAFECGIRVPLTSSVNTADELAAWIDRNGLPAVLKGDGTYGGRGVRILQNRAEIEPSFRALSSPPSPLRAIKRALVNRDSNYLFAFFHRTQPVVTVQRFIAGRDANCTVACWNGRVLSRITVILFQAVEPRGPASVVRRVENDEMSSAVEKIVCRLKLSGMFGFDFLLEAGTGEPYLIEMNPRATQICHLRLGTGRDLPGSLRAAVTGDSVGESPSVTDNDVIAFFPQEWLRDPSSHFLRTAYHDVPWDEPELVRAAMEEDLRFTAWAAVSSKLRSARGWLGT